MNVSGIKGATQGVAQRTQGIAQRNRPATAGGIAGAVSAVIYALSEWGLDALTTVTEVPANVQASLLGLVVVVAGFVGTAIGKWAQRHTWAEETHKAGVAYALQLDPEAWGEALSALGLTRDEALTIIGADPEEAP